MTAAAPDATCSALTGSGKSCQAAAITTLHGEPYCHRKSHQRQAKPPTTLTPAPVVAAAKLAPAAKPAPKPKLTVVKPPPAPAVPEVTYPCNCGEIMTRDTARTDWPASKAAAGLIPLKCGSCGDSAQVLA